MKNANNTPKFEAWNIYEMRYIGDADLKTQWICVKRTAKTVTFERFQSTEKITKRIKFDHDGGEYILKGTYSMAPSIYAKRIVG